MPPWGWSRRDRITALTGPEREAYTFYLSFSPRPWSRCDGWKRCWLVEPPPCIFIGRSLELEFNYFKGSVRRARQLILISLQFKQTSCQFLGTHPFSFTSSAVPCQFSGRSQRSYLWKCCPQAAKIRSRDKYKWLHARAQGRAPSQTVIQVDYRWEVLINVPDGKFHLIHEVYFHQLADVWKRVAAPLGFKCFKCFFFFAGWR